MPPALTRSLFAVALTLTACGGDAPQDDKSPTEKTTQPGSPSTQDTTPPTVLSTTPETGAVGQWADVVVAIQFSESMDPATVEAALDTSELGAVDIHWDDTHETVTITPVAELEYATAPGDSPGVLANRYTVRLASGATDYAGNALEADTEIAFDTLKALWLVLKADDALTRSLTPTGLVYDPTDPLVVGDDAANSAIRSTISFDISWLPAETVAVSDAVLATRQLVNDAWGTPYVDLNATMSMDHVSFPSLEDDNAANYAFNTSEAAHATFADVCTDGQVPVEVDVTDAVDDDLANRAARMDLSQFLLRFDTYTDLFRDVDRAVISRDLIELQVEYLVP